MRSLPRTSTRIQGHWTSFSTKCSPHSWVRAKTGARQKHRHDAGAARHSCERRHYADAVHVGVDDESPLARCCNEATKILEKSLVSCEDKYVPWGEFEVKASALLSLSETIFNDVIFGFKHPMVDEELRHSKYRQASSRKLQLPRIRKTFECLYNRRASKRFQNQKLSQEAVQECRPSKTMSAARSDQSGC